jgi:hypothetical protein
MADETISEKVWGFNYKTLTYKGMADIMIDITKIIISVLLIWNYPIAFSNTSGEINTSPLTWIGTVLLLAVVAYILFPALMRLLYGRYSHWIRKEESNGEQNGSN